jgi:hypothetical protein
LEIYVGRPNWLPTANPKTAQLLAVSRFSEDVEGRNARRGIGGQKFRCLVASLFGNSLRSFRPFLSDGLRIAAAAARSLNFASLDAITPFDLDAWHGKWDSYGGSLLNDRPILRT